MNRPDGFPLPDRVSGTWDFKWPQGHRIHVAFQALPTGVERDQDRLIERVRTVATRWLSGTANISFGFELDRLLPAPDGTSRSELPARQELPPYDVLVSFQSLPVAEPKRRGTRNIPMPCSQLGSNSRRVDYGIPTTYLGAPPRYRPERTSYFDSEMFDHTILHEFGHVLGLAHEHQNPKRTVAWQPTARIVERLRELGIDTQPEHVLAEVTRPWPTARADGAPVFSDWRDPGPNDDSAVPLFDSVMTYPVCASLLAGAPAVRLDDLVWPVAPTPADLAHLRAMYPERRSRR